MTFSVISAVNNEDTLNRCLLASPEIGKLHEVISQRGFDNAADAYNAAVAKASGEVLVWVHQDVYLPDGWFSQLEATIHQLAHSDPQWGVLGVYGMTADGDDRGYLYCTGNQCKLGRPIQGPVEVGTLDEVVLVLRKDSGLRFDTRLKGFHFYGADICLTARQRGLNCYVVPGFCIHNTNGYGMFPRSFWQGYFYMRRKWKPVLPVRTTCIEIGDSLRPVVRGTVWRFLWLKGKRVKIAKRVEDPQKLYAGLIANCNPPVT